MNTPIPHGLSRSVMESALPIRDELVKAGWVFGQIHWDREPERKLAFSAKSPDGKSVYISCQEDALTEKLRSLLHPRGANA